MDSVAIYKGELIVGERSEFGVLVRSKYHFNSRQPVHSPHPRRCRLEPLEPRRLLSHSNWISGDDANVESLALHAAKPIAPWDTQSNHTIIAATEEPRIASQKGGMDVEITGFRVAADNASELLVEYRVTDTLIGNPIQIAIFQSDNGIDIDHGLNPLLAGTAIPSSTAIETAHFDVSFSDIEDLDYYLVAEVDYTGELPESIESNNCLAFEGGLFRSGPVLHIQSATSHTADTIHLGTDAEQLYVTWQIEHNPQAVDTFYWPAADITELHIRSHLGADSIHVDNELGKAIWVFGGDGNDWITGGDGADLLYGNAGADQLIGGQHDDMLFGGAGADRLVGQQGNDFLAGGADRDIILAIDGNDTGDGGPGFDFLYAYDGTHTLHGGDDNDTFITNSGTHHMLYGDAGDDRFYSTAANDSSFGGDGNDFFYMAITSHHSIHGENGDDQLIARSEANWLYGGDGNDHLQILGSVDNNCLFGDAGDDLIQGGLGADEIHGGAGNDIIQGSSGNDRLFGDAGEDSIEGGDGADQLSGGDDADQLYGGNGDDLLEGGFNGPYVYSAPDMLDGESGDDTYRATEGSLSARWIESGGNDTYLFEGTELGSIEILSSTVSGSAGTDTLDFSGMNSGIHIGLASNLPQSICSGLELYLHTHNESEPYAEIENVIGSPFNDHILGNRFANRLEGCGGVDTLRGFAGDDILIGGGNDAVSGLGDQLYGGIGNDILRVSPGAARTTLYEESGSDSFQFEGIDLGHVTIEPNANAGGDDENTLDFSDLTNPVILALETGTEQVVNDDLCLELIQTKWHIDQLFYLQLDHVIGTSADDTILGNLRPNRLEGGLGNDQLDGLGGDDQLIGGAGNDILSGGPDADHLEGNGGDDILHGGEGNDFLETGSNTGFDRAFGESGNDTYLAGSGIFTEFYEDTGNDQFLFDASSSGTILITAADSAFAQGIDTLDFSCRHAAIDLVLGENVPQDLADGLYLRLFNESWSAAIENVIGTGLDDRIIGNALDNSLFGGPGDDYLEGGGNTGNRPEILAGGDGNDSSIVSDGSVDTLCIEDLGNDTYVFPAGDLGHVRIEAAQDHLASHQDWLDFSAMNTPITVSLAESSVQTINASLTLQLVEFTDEANQQRPVRIENVWGTPYGDDITGNDLANELWGGGGDDWLQGGASDDRLQGGAGDDTLAGDAGRDYLDGGPGMATVMGGGDGDDWYVLHNQSAAVVQIVEMDGKGRDLIDLSAATDPEGARLDLRIAGPQAVFPDVVLDLSAEAGAAMEILLGTPYADQLDGNDASNLISGRGGSDQIHGHGGNDVLYGGGDIDWLHGGVGDDMLIGGSGSDTLFGDAGNDFLDGGIGDDLLTGGAGDDGLDGGFGTDTLDETGLPILHFAAGESAGEVSLGRVTYLSPPGMVTVIQQGTTPQNQVVRVIAPGNLNATRIAIDIMVGDQSYHYSKNWMISGSAVAGYIQAAFEECPFVTECDYAVETTWIDSQYQTDIEFKGLCGHRDDVGITVSAGTVTQELIQTGMAAVDTIQTLITDPQVLHGYFSLEYAGNVSAALPVDASVNQIETAIESISGLDVQAIGLEPGTWAITFLSVAADTLVPVAAGPNRTVDWGDGEPASIPELSPPPLYPLNSVQPIDLRGEHIYADAGVYVIEVTVEGATHGNDFNPTWKQIAAVGSIDSDADGISDSDEFGIGTDPYDFDTDNDLLPDGFEEDSENLDPLVPDDSQGDPDSDLLSNLDELIYNTDPDRPDTDGDGVNDRTEVDQGSDPNDASDGGIAPVEEMLVHLELNVGDDSGSHSERWELQVGDRSHQSPDFGVLSGWTPYIYWKGSTYEITLDHMGSNITPPDHDWYADIRLGSSEDDLILIENPAFVASDGAQLRLLGYPEDTQHENCVDNIDDASGRKAYLHIPYVDLDLILPNGGELADALEESPGGSITSGNEELLELVVRPLDPQALYSLPGTFTITYTSERIRIWRDANRTEAILSGSTDLELYLEHPLYVEGIAESESPGDVAIQLSYAPGDLDLETYSIMGTDAADTIRLTVAHLDLDIDSNNQSGLERSAAEDTIEDDPGLPGKFVDVNMGDTDHDGIVDFADGFNWDGIDGNADDIASGLTFVPLVIELAEGFDFPVARITIDYSASDPSAVSWEEGQMVPPSTGGHLRLWTADGATARDVAPALAESDPGNFIAPGEYRPEDLGLSPTNRSTTLYLEAIRPSDSLGGDRITFEVDPDGSAGPAVSTYTDAVRVTAQLFDLRIDGLGETWETEPGAVIWRNNDFSKAVEDGDYPDSDPVRYRPDYETLYFFDPDYLDDYTLASLEIAPWMIETYQIRFDIYDSLPNADNITLWTFTEWDGVASLPGGHAAGDPWRVPSGILLTPTTSRLDFWIEGIANSTSFGFPDNHIRVTGLSQNFGLCDDEAKYTVVETNAAVDGNRDGTIDFSNSNDRRLLFWYNNDRETVDDDGYEREDPELAGADCDDNLIAQRRDLEDFAAFQIQISPILHDAAHDLARYGIPDPEKLHVTYRLLLEQDGGSSINLFRAADLDPLAHVNNESVAAAQVTDPYNEALTTFLGEWQFLGASGTTAYLFESFGIQHATPQLVFSTIVEYPNGSTTEQRHAIDLDLRDFTNFYDRYRILYTEMQRRQIDFDTFDQIHFADAVRIQQSSVHGMPFFNADENMVLVHGWNMPAEPGNDWKRAFAETAFKRLYWQGFAGQCIEFDWPTYYDAEGPRDWPIIGEAANYTYNPSEYVAYRSGRALMHHLAGLPGKTHLLAHSMGNVVVAEALRQWNAIHDNEALVENYVSMQSAISAGIYGDLGNEAFDINFNENIAWIHEIHSQSRVDLNREWWAGFPNAASLNQDYMTGTESAANNWINMYNPDDYATSFAWKLNNLMKHFLNREVPDIPNLPGAGDDAIWSLLSAWLGFDIHDQVWRLLPPPEIWPHRYLVEHDEINGHAYFRIPYSTENVWNVDRGLWTNITSGLQAADLPYINTYEIIAFLSQANSAAVGSHAVPLWFDIRLNIIDLGLNTIDDQSPYFSGKRQNHSFQFHHDSSATWDFWLHIKQSTLFDGTYDD